MADYILTKSVDRKTGELPDRVTYTVPLDSAKVLVKSLLMQIFDGKATITLDLFGTLRKEQ